MTDRDKRAWHIRALYALLPNAGWDAIKFLAAIAAYVIGASGIITLISRRLALLRGIRHDNLIDIGIFISCVVLFALAFMFAKYIRKAAQKSSTPTEQIESQPAKYTGIAFDVDTKSQSDARLRAHWNLKNAFGTGAAETEIDFYILTTRLKMRFENHDVHPRAFNRIELSMIERQDGLETVKQFLEEPVILVIDPVNNQPNAMTDFVFEPQRAGIVWFHFDARIQQKDAENLSNRSFLRVTVHALGQPPLSQDLAVNWADALRNETYLRRRPL